MSKSFRIQENVYNTFLKLKNRKKQQQFLEKCFIYAWENREIETDYDVDLAFCGVKPSIKLSNNGGGLNNPTGINGTKPLKNKENDMSDYGQSEVSVMSDGGQSFISNKDISNKNEDTSNKSKEIIKESNMKYGELGNVLLTEKQYNQLLESINNVDKAIEELDTWLSKDSANSKKYIGKNHYGFFKSNSWVWDRVGGYSKKIKLEEKPFYPAEHDFDMFGEKLWGDKKCTITE